MFAEPRQLIGETIEKLETVSAYFAEEIDEQHRSVGQLPLETLAAKEALQTIKILISKIADRSGEFGCAKLTAAVP
jgi:hypothetical protein